MAERQPLLASAGVSSRPPAPKTKGVHPVWSPSGKKWLKKPTARARPGRNFDDGPVSRKRGDSSSEDEDNDCHYLDTGITGNVGEKIRQPSARERWAYYLDYTTLGRWWHVLDAALNVAFVLLFVYMTTYIIAPKRGNPNLPPQRPAPPPDGLFVADLVLACAILTQWLPRVYLSLDPMADLVSWFSLVSFLATLPVIWAFVQKDDAKSDYLDASQVLAFLYPLRFWRMHLSIMMVFTPSKNVAFNFSPITQKAVRLGLSIFNTLITVTAWVHICLYIIQKYYDLSFFDVFYTIAVSSTSGLSTQIIPDNPFSRIVIMYVMIVGAIFIPTNLADLLALIRNKSKYDRSYKSTNRSHVLIAGNFEITSLRDFLWEFFCEDHGAATMTTQVVLLNPYEPSEELEALLADPLYLSRVRYVKGSPMSFRSLEKAQASTAKACFVLASRLSDKPAVEDDAETVMTALAIKKFHKKANIFAQVILPGNKTHFQILADHILCIDEFKLGMLAQSCLAPGFSTLLYLLTTSIPDAVKKALKSKKRLAAWVDEFADGAEMEIYAVTLSSAFAGMSFPEVAERVYMVHFAVLFAVGFKTDDSEPWIVMNPQDYIIKGGETAYIITTQSAVAETIATQGVVLNDVPDTPVGSLWNGVGTSWSKEATVDMGISQMDGDQEQGASFYDDRTENPSRSPPVKSFSSGSLSASAKDDLISFGQKARPTASVEQEPPSAASILSSALPRGKFKESDVAPTEPTTVSVPDSVVDHVLICSLSPTFPQNLAFFIAPFRHKDLRPIVILCAEEPAADQWIKLAAFTEVYYIVGTPLLRKDLQRAKVEKAWRAVIMANPQQPNVADRAADAQALLSVLNVQAMTSVVDERHIFTMVEFIHAENAKFIGHGEKYYNDGVHGHNLMPCFVAGHVFFNAMFSSLLCQTYYNPHLLHVLKHFIFNGTHTPPQHTTTAEAHPTTLFRSDSAPSWFNYLAHVRAPQPSHPENDPDDKSQVHGNLFQISLPSDGRFTGVSYGALFRSLLRNHRTLALGLYRRTVERNNLVKYVVVNPRPSLRVREDDLVYVFAEKIPIW
ncbi:uncharacterized protein SPPG_01198 [Spizellomyces punctatus DAOM BR117]|uniref:RCK N-terminal domain-containing protein n=1 Tax=Spizellomyces punctatus (strain DAOM BR117) TaxID=645134 RepID=A0A0L0HS60_SPIPD|nr:uncharacterized protein SPPG_01198 [Spizellomyces punctatus DAOM BR117]KND03740.1 hypothetical protein SPPG_01198 [Spizellomyces punctatus DAOM BR117]|eukprot:XP_016611779.1 hypothetical protein SPPG_01198 [Spizellomyces punctatus DAOM BR117]